MAKRKPVKAADIEVPPLQQKSIEEATRLSIQERARDPDVGGSFNLLLYMAQAGELVAPWWSRRRDLELDMMWRNSDHMSGAMYTLAAKLASVPVRVEPRNPRMRSHMKLADEYTRRLVEETEFGAAWPELFTLGLLDLWGSDNGLFYEVIGPGPAAGPVMGPAAGLAHLDSARCTRVSDPEFPVVYEDLDGQRYKLHRTRVAFTSQMPSTRHEMRKMGFCWMSRAVNTAQNLIDIQRYKQEKLGSRPLRGILVGAGVKGGVIGAALDMSKSMADARGHSLYFPVPVIEDIPADANIRLISFSDLPDGFDEKESTQLGMCVIAMTGGFPIRWIWPATTVGATKGDAEFQHVAGLGGGAGYTLRVIQLMLGGPPEGEFHLGGKFLPPTLKMVFDFQDDIQDKASADIQAVRAETRDRDIASGVVDLRVAREKAMSSGDLTKAQFRELELRDGRLEDGRDVLTLFVDDDPDVRRLLDIGVPEPLDVASNDPDGMLVIIQDAVIEVQAEIGRTSAPSKKNLAEEALAALVSLGKMYEEARNSAMVPQAPDTEGEVREDEENGEDEDDEDRGEEQVEA